MADRPVDPAGLEGDALTRWYRRTPQQIAEERRRAAAEAYDRFFYPTPSDPAPNAEAVLDHQNSWLGDGQEPTGRKEAAGDRSASFAAAPPAVQTMEKTTPFPSPYGTGLLGDWRRYADAPVTNPGRNVNKRPDDTLWMATGSGGYRPVRSPNSDSGTELQTHASLPDGLPGDPAALEDADFIDVGNPHNPRLRRQWVKANNKPWPKTDDGRNYHVAHKRAIADGGTNTLDNIEPMHPDEHIAQHINNGDSARWGVRAAIARAFGGTVEPPTPGVVSRSVGLLQMLSIISGLLSRRIRTDAPVHTWYDMAGYRAPDDYEHMVDPTCRAMGINEPGKICT
jgi:hypothetical protein